MADFPEPLTPPGCDLRDFAYMPLDVTRLRDSDLAATEPPESCWAAVLLWSASWHQIPAASLPDDDRVLSNLSGYGRVVKEWQRVKEGAMRGWVKCSDGRLYHPVVAEKACESWDSKQRHAYGKMGERLRKLNKHRAENQLQPLAQPNFEQWISAGKVDPVPPESPKPSTGIPSETTKPSAGKPKSSAGIPPEKTLKGEGEGKGYVLIPGAKAPLSPAKLPTCQTQSVIDLYHEILPNLPKVRLHTKDRVKAIRKVWDWVLTSLKPDQSRRAETAEQALEWFRSYFERATDNDFLMGRTPRQGVHADWQCDIDFLLTDRGMKQVIEKTREAA